MSQHKGPKGFKVLVVVCTVLLGLTSWVFIGKPFAPPVDPELSMPSSDPSPTPVQSPSPVAIAQACEGQQAFVPQRVVIKQLGISIPIESLPLRKDGTYPVPSYDQPGVDPKWSAARWNENALACAEQGVVRLDVHTYAVGGAVGNRLGQEAQAGNVIRVKGANGAKACYYTKRVKAWDVAEIPYDEITSPAGAPGLVLEFCWDEKSEWGQWNQRKYVIATSVSCK